MPPRLRPVGPSQNALRHGATSPSTVAAVALAERRRLLRRNGIRVSDLDGIALALLDAWSRAHAKVVLLDAWFNEHGFLSADGAPASAARIYFVALNASTRALARLEEHLRNVRDPRDPLALLEGEGRRVRLSAEAAS